MRIYNQEVRKMKKIQTLAASQVKQLMDEEFKRNGYSFLFRKLFQIHDRKVSKE